MKKLNIQVEQNCIADRMFTMWVDDKDATRFMIRCNGRDTLWHVSICTMSGLYCPDGALTAWLKAREIAYEPMSIEDWKFTLYQAVMLHGVSGVYDLENCGMIAGRRWLS